MNNPRLVFILTLILTAPLAGITHAEVTGVRDGAQLTREVDAKVRDISTQDLRREIEKTPQLVLIDIRMPDEIQSMGGAIKSPQNVNIPRGWLEFHVTRHAQNKNTPIVVYCGGNIRSILAAHTLQQMGYTNVKNYPDGFIGWKRQGLPVE